MAEQQDTRREQYARARTEFDHLSVEDKALFLIEATAATLARGVEEAGRALADEIDRWFHRAEDPDEATEEEAASDEESPKKTKASAKKNGNAAGKKKGSGTSARKKSSGGSKKKDKDEGS